ncbi:hypothetical protein KOR42_07980 [Thalassoglobus neptunius]|uniref:Uncharacterized protein n=1 Tax=Thalassoglobus neptunius TaxID=1938619 RepID=A0A5C5X2Z4_9PLAN|nr:hypothetical protein [Thalassoglobus neptunius]TWT57437.1 hypothetical protein KOR42_07980 [Thalassoglobus neptunius]
MTSTSVCRNRETDVVQQLFILGMPVLLLLILGGNLALADSPLDRLSKRSAVKRWEEVKENWIPDKASESGSQEDQAPPALPKPAPAGEYNPPTVADPPLDQADSGSTETPSLFRESNQSNRLAPVEMNSDPQAGADILVPDPYATPPGGSSQVAESLPFPEAVINTTTPESAVMVAQRGDSLPLPDPYAGQKLPSFQRIGEIQPFYDYSPTGVAETKLSDFQPLPSSGDFERNYGTTHYQWMASNLASDPLYFEDVQLERYGHTYPCGLQPFVSAGKFGVQLIGLPYQMALNPVWDEHYALGYYRPGDCAPKLCYRIPWNKKAAATAAGVYTGLIFLFP